MGGPPGIVGGMDTTFAPDLSSSSATLVVPGLRNGPPGMGNGGWTAGSIARHLGSRPGGPAVEVTLRRPAPLDRPLRVDVEGDAASLHDGPTGSDSLVATARVVERDLLAPAPVDLDAAEAAEAAFLGWHQHPFPDCVVCGTARGPHEALRIFPGPVEGRDGVVAGRWHPSPNMVDHRSADLRILDAAVWGALDCPTGWAHASGDGGVALLGRLTAQLHRPVLPTADLVVVAEQAGRYGRKLHARAALYTPSGTLLAQSEAIWIEVAAAVAGPSAAGG